MRLFKTQNIYIRIIFMMIIFLAGNLYSLNKEKKLNQDLKKIAGFFNTDEINIKRNFFDISKKSNYSVKNNRLKNMKNLDSEAIKIYNLEPAIISYLIKNKVEKHLSNVEINNDFISGLHIFDSYYMTRWQIEMDLIFKILATSLSQDYPQTEKFLKDFNDLRLYQEYNLNQEEIEKEKKYWSEYSKEGREFSNFCRSKNILRTELFYRAVQNSEIPNISNEYIKENMFWISFAIEIMPKNIQEQIAMFPNPEIDSEEKTRIWQKHSDFDFKNKRKIWKENITRLNEKNYSLKYKFELISSSKPYLDFDAENASPRENGSYFFKVKNLYISNKDFQCLKKNVPLLEISSIGSVYKITFYSNHYLKFSLNNEDNSLKLISNNNPRLILENNCKTLIYGDDRFNNIPKKYLKITKELNEKLIAKGVNTNWLAEQIRNKHFKIYPQMQKYFTRMPEHQVVKTSKNKKKKDFNWYKRYFAVNSKIVRGKKFISKHKEFLESVQKKHGIPYQLIVAILGIETNYAEKKQKGNFYVFNSLYSQYLLLPERRKFALNELVHLNRFTQKTQTDVFYYIGSFAGACGWGQFIPSSLNSYFIDSNNVESKVDIYSLEDNVASIENYLYNNGLRGKKLTSKNIYNAVYAYNHSDFYVKSVMEIYAGLIMKN